MDNFNTLSNRLLNRCPAAGIILCQQFVSDAFSTLQARREWSWRRGHSTFAPPDIYVTGYATTNAAAGNPTIVTGTGTSWTPNMVGRQIRIGGYLFPFYTIVGWQSATSLIIDQPWFGNDQTMQSYTIQQVYFPVPDDFAYFYAVVSIKDGFRLWLNVTEAEIDMMDPQRTNFGQSYAVAFRDYTNITQGIISPCQPLGNYTGNPVSTTVAGFSYPVPATYLIQIQGSGATGTATYVWTRIGNGGFSAPVLTTDFPLDLSDGVQVFFPDGVNWTSGNSWVITAVPLVTSGVPRYEMWPGPTYSAYLYPFQYIKKEYSLTNQNPTLPPFIANRGEVVLEMALEKCAEFPGSDADHLNIYHDLRQAKYHHDKVLDMLVDLERNDEEIGVTQLDYQSYPLYPAPWLDGQWEQRHAPFLNG